MKRCDIIKGPNQQKTSPRRGGSNELAPIQCKLKIGGVDDSFEKEADDTANKIMRMPDPPFIQRKCDQCEEEGVVRKKELPVIQKKCSACDEEEKKIDRKPLSSFIQKKENDGNSTATDAVASGIESTRGSGSAMDDETRSFMETRFGADFSGVKIHNGSNAAHLSNKIQAQAFTVGNDIYFNEGKYAPESDAGKHLLAHELTHTIQQAGLANNLIKQNSAR